MVSPPSKLMPPGTPSLRNMGREKRMQPAAKELRPRSLAAKSEAPYLVMIRQRVPLHEQRGNGW